jgi:hypothetical protein
MALLNDLRDTIAESVFTDEIASSATLSSLTAPSTDKWGDEQSAYGTGATISIIPFQYIGNRLNYQPFGDLQEGQMDCVVAYNTAVGVRDKLTWQGEDYLVTEMDKSAFLGGGLVVQIIRFTRTQ